MSNARPEQPAMSADAQGGERVRVLFPDNLNLARGKYLSRSVARKGRAGFCLGAYAVTYGRQLLPAPGGGLAAGLPDMEACFDPDDLRPGWEPNTRIALADVELGGKPNPLCARSLLKRTIGQWRQAGYDPIIGLEGEAYIFQRDADGRWIPYDTPGAVVYGTGSFTDPAGLIDEIWAQAEACGLPVESINGEYDPAQFELTLQHADALKACDDFFVFRTMAREMLYGRGYLLSFLPKPLADRGGSGLHVNVSFRDATGTNALSGATRRGEFSGLVSGCVAGLLEHHEGLAALLAPTVNSYARLKPASLAGYWANWGIDHRSAAVRVSAESGDGARLEHRVADGAAGPHLATAAVLQAARLGFERGRNLPPEETGDGLESVNTDRHTPSDLSAALDALEADADLGDALGTALIANYLAVKRAEIDEIGSGSPAEIFDYYAPFI